MKLKIVNTFLSVRVIVVFVACIAACALLLGFSIGVWVSDTHQKTSNQLGLPEFIDDTVYPYHRVHIYDGDVEEWTYKDFDAELYCLAKNIYFEARNQDIQGQIAVGLVTINRVLSPKHPNSICDVVWRKLKNKKGKWVAHFSWTLDGNSNIPVNLEIYEENIRLAEAMLDGRTLDNFVDITYGSTHYHAHYVTPWWSYKLTHTISVGDHIFYNSSPVAIAK